jgi:hypothetical protein
MHIRISTQKKQAILPVELGTTRLGENSASGGNPVGENWQKKDGIRIFFAFSMFKS